MTPYWTGSTPKRRSAPVSEGPSGALGATEAGQDSETTPAPVGDAEGPQNATEGRDDDRVVIARLPKSKYALRETPDGWDVLADDDHGAFS